jgi:hypothetical protein
VGSEGHGLSLCALAYLVSEEPLDGEVDADADFGFQLSTQFLEPHVVRVANLDEEIQIRTFAILTTCHGAEDAGSRSTVSSQDASQLRLVPLELAAYGAREAVIQCPQAEDELLASRGQQPLERRQARGRRTGLVPGDRWLRGSRASSERILRQAGAEPSRAKERRDIHAAMLYRFRYRLSRARLLPPVVRKLQR